MKSIVFALPENEKLAKSIALSLEAETGEFLIRHFPDGETYIKINSDVLNKRVILICTLNQPDAKLLPLYFMSKTAKSLGAKCTCIVSPYLAYMRQDKRFNPGEAITSEYFASMISTFADSLITIDPHLHRRTSLSEIYSIPTQVIHAANHISDWIKNNIKNAVLIGPDKESEQWVSEVARKANAPFIVLEKNRKGDRDVEVSIPHVEKFKEHIPVLVDDIISTARTMIETVIHLKAAGMKPPICIGVHAVFADNAFKDLVAAGAEKIVTCNSIIHESNSIDISDLLVNALKNT
jgi:ribose-phosphate pyrophosphokinase